MKGFIFQNFNLLPRYSTWENVALPLAYRRGEFRSEEQYQKAMQMLSRVGLAGRARHRPTDLSGGERQRVAIARALITHPAVLLADEPTGNLDTKTGQEVFSLLRMLSSKFRRTIVMVTHNPELAEATDRAVFIRDGMVETEVTF